MTQIAPPSLSFLFLLCLSKSVYMYVKNSVPFSTALIIWAGGAVYILGKGSLQMPCAQCAFNLVNSKKKTNFGLQCTVRFLVNAVPGRNGNSKWFWGLVRETFHLGQFCGHFSLASYGGKLCECVIGKNASSPRNRALFAYSSGTKTKFRIFYL